MFTFAKMSPAIESAFVAAGVTVVVCAALQSVAIVLGWF